MTTMNGNDYLLYHAYDGVPGAKERDTLIDRVTWANGWPVVANGTPTEVPQPYPF
jgi:arabinan endo-1,5-alpha-L-arabinosidase